ncbi:MAG: hypothetical protein ACOC1F_05090 [Myxococcota bacterium]
MPAAHTRWTVLEHGPIEKLHDRLWRVEGEIPNMGLRRVMTIARMDDDRLVIHSAIALDDASMKEIEAWGDPSYLVVPNGWHRLDAPAFKERYPSIRVICPRGSRKAVEKVVAVDGSYDDLPSDLHVSLEHAPGTKDGEGVMLVRGEGGTTLVFNDLIFNLPHGRGLAGLVFRVIGSTGGPRVTRVGKWFVVKDRKALRVYLEKLASQQEIERIIMSHGAPITVDPAGVLRSIAETL